MKSLFLSAVLIVELVASEQILLVVADDFETSHAVLQRYEKRGERFQLLGESINVNIGRNGLGWGEGKLRLRHADDEPVKQEGDGKAPAGIFALTGTFGYSLTFPTTMPYRQATADLICVDDSDSSYYNQLVKIDASKPVKSFEWMRRDDELYAVGITVAHNTLQKKNAGSCIFLHIEKGKNLPTAGCTSMSRKDLETVTKWLEPASDPLLIQMPRLYCPEAENRYPGLQCP